MNDMIKRQDAIKAIETMPNAYNGFSDTYDKACIIGVLEEIPSAQPEQKHGRWVDEDDGAYYPVECSECRKIPLFDLDGDYILSNFCPNCGARMDKGDES